MLAPSNPNSPAINSRSRKRYHSSSIPPRRIEARHSTKKRKICHPDFPPPKFYENVSNKYLEKNTLRAHNEKNSREQPIAVEPFNSSLPAYPYFGRTRRSYKQLAERVAAEGPPDLSDLRGYKVPASNHGVMPSSQSSLGRRKRGSQSPQKSSQSPSKSWDATNSTSTKSTGPYDRTFLQHLIDHGSLPPNHVQKDGRLSSEALAELRQVFTLPVEELIPTQFSDTDFEHFQLLDSNATKERQVMSAVIPILEGKLDDTRCVCGETPFTNLNHLTDGSLVPGNPDRCFGNRPETLNRRVRDMLSHDICPFTQGDLPILPNCFLEVKGPDGSAAVAERQLLYVMSLGERGYIRLLSYGSAQSIYDGKAHTLGFSYLSGQLKAYACHAIPPTTSSGRPTFVMTFITSWSVVGDREQFCKGASAFRNGIRWAKAMRDRVIKQANEKAASLESSFMSSSEVDSDASAEGTIITSQETVVNEPGYSISKIYESDTSADELSFDQPLPKRKSRSPTKRL